MRAGMSNNRSHAVLKAKKRIQAFYKDIHDTIKDHKRFVLAVPDGTYLNEMSERMIKQGKAFDHGEVINTTENIGSRLSMRHTRLMRATRYKQANITRPKITKFNKSSCLTKRADFPAR
jgi:hypothetical protein